MDNRECSFLAGGIIVEKNNENIFEENMSLEEGYQKVSVIREKGMYDYITHLFEKAA